MNTCWFCALEAVYATVEGDLMLCAWHALLLIVGDGYIGDLEA